MTNQNIKEIQRSVSSGLGMLFLFLMLLLASIAGLIGGAVEESEGFVILSILCLIVGIFGLFGLFTVAPN